jgi:hypothetical protein
VKFDYTKVKDFPKHQPRERILPWIRFGVFNPKDKSKILYPVGLIDSGSDLTIIDCEIGQNLGFNIKKGKEVDIVGLGGKSIKAYLHQTGFCFNDEDSKEPVIYEDYIAFTEQPFPQSTPQQTAILGTHGFFNHFNVTFKYPVLISVTEALDPRLN